MNFVETAPVTTPRIAAEAIEPTPVKTAAPCQTKAFGVSFALTVAVFSFTLLGLITTGNWITDNVVIPKLYGQQSEEMKQSTQPEITDNTATVETTMAK
jgi:p-aminobenzoyl-glutamate transporter AbgT